MCIRQAVHHQFQTAPSTLIPVSPTDRTKKIPAMTRTLWTTVRIGHKCAHAGRTAIATDVILHPHCVMLQIIDRKVEFWTSSYKITGVGNASKVLSRVWQVMMA
jgi:hypothetical protein